MRRWLPQEKTLSLKDIKGSKYSISCEEQNCPAKAKTRLDGVQNLGSTRRGKVSFEEERKTISSQNQEGMNLLFILQAEVNSPLFFKGKHVILSFQLTL